MTQTERVGRPRRTAEQVTVDLIHSEPDTRAAVDALGQIWVSDDGQAPLPSELAWVLAHSGNYVAVARAGDQVVGATIGFRGMDAEGAFLHSHIAGVVPSWQSAGVGYQLKQHQRRWALAQGLDRITWTFDPLVARNAYFNVVKLGAELTDYFVDFYGSMDDTVNAGDETDRCLVTWRLRSDRAVSAAAGVFVAADARTELEAGTADVLRADKDGRPVVATSTAERRIVQLPTDVVELRHRDPQQALAWRMALREVLVAAFADGLEVVGVSRDGHYVLNRAG